MSSSASHFNFWVISSIFSISYYIWLLFRRSLEILEWCYSLTWPSSDLNYFCWRTAFMIVWFCALIFVCDLQSWGQTEGHHCSPKRPEGFDQQTTPAPCNKVDHHTYYTPPGRWRKRGFQSNSCNVCPHIKGDNSNNKIGKLGVHANIERLEIFAQNLDKDDCVMLVARSMEWHFTILKNCYKSMVKCCLGIPD